MDIAVEISLYPLNQDYIPPIQGFIDRLNAEPRVKVVTNSMSTQVSGPYDAVFGLLQREVRATMEHEPKVVFVMKVLGPLGPA
ncbi:MAG: YkoF family thiamine/hydroxymethylpyrimidine-binding protein [Steroidobacteraceae bacterium]